MNTALILSGGTGTRLGTDIPKQYLEVAGRPIISYSFEQLAIHPDVDMIWIVADPAWHEFILESVERYDIHGKFKGFAEPGKNRQLSIFNGLEGILEYASDTDSVFIHDAARPLLSAKMITECFAGMEGHEGVLPVLPMKDTVYLSKDGKTVTALLNRSEIFAGQAPEVFKFGRYYVANKMLLPELILGINGSTEPAIMAGMDIAMIPGDERNFKVTTRADLERFREIVEG